MRNPKPTTAKRQLRRYYTLQGLQGQAHRHAVRADMKLVRKNCTPRDFEIAQSMGCGFDAMFTFCGTPQGGRYWYVRCAGNWS